MVKKKLSQSAQGFGFNSQSLTKQLIQVQKYISQKQWPKAQAKLEELQQCYPNNRQVLNTRITLAYAQKDWISIQNVAEQLSKISPDDPEVWLALAGAYLKNVFPLLALQTCRQFLEKFPHHFKVKEVKEMIADLENALDELLINLTLEGKKDFEIGLLHEKVRSLLEQHQYSEACQLSEHLFTLAPNFLPAYNNLSLAYYCQGKISEAIATAQQVLEKDPENYHAVANLIRFYVVSGQTETALKLTECLKKLNNEIGDTWLKKAEAFAYLGDNQSLKELSIEAETGNLSEITGLFWHLVAVAHANLGEEKKAIQLWRKALKASPELSIAQKNLDNLKQPVGKRHSPWVFELEGWLHPEALQDLIKLVQDKSGKSGEHLAQHYLQQHPEIVIIAPLLLKQGSPLGTELAVRLAMSVETPELLEALKDFVLGDRGTDELRLEAAQVVSQAGLILSGTVRMWMKGQWQELLLMGMEITDQPSVKHSKKVDRLHIQAIIAIKEGEGEKAESILQQALKLEPDAPDLKFNLAGAYQLQERHEEALALVQQIQQTHPDYAFAPILLARQLLQKKEIEAADELLKPLLSKKQFHFQEYSQFCEAQIELAVARKNLDIARSWLEMWENVDPAANDIPYWKKRLKDKHSWLLK